MTQDSTEEKIEKANTRWETVVTVPEDNSSWGFYAYGDAPPAIGGGFGSFVWFSGRAEMLDSIAQVLPYSPPGRSDLDWGEVARETSSIVEQMSANLIDNETAVSQLNSALVSFSQFEWLGTFGDLLAGDHNYAKNVREGFWSVNDEGEAESSREIDAPVLNEFKDFLSSWGA